MTTDSFSRTPTVPSHAGDRADSPSSWRRLLAVIGFANFGIWVTYFTPILVTMQVRVGQIAPGNRESVLSFVLGASSICGIVANPLAGRLSDRTTSRWGMRRPWLVGGMLVGLVGLVTEGVATNVVVFFLGACITLVGFSISLTIVLSLLPDHIPTERRGTVAGTMGITQSLAVTAGAVVGGALSGNILLAFVVPWVVGAVSIALLCAVLHDRVLDRRDRVPLRLKSLPASFWTSPRRYPDFGWTWLSRFLLFTAFSTVINYQVFYLTGQLGLTTAEATRFVGVALGFQSVILIASSGLMGFLSDRLGRRKIFVILAGLLAAVALVVLATATTLPRYFVAFALAGLAQGTYFAVDLALVADVLPDQRNAAKDLGVMAIASQLPQSVAPALAPVFLGISFGSVVAGAEANFTMLYVASAVFAFLAAVSIIPIRGVR